MKAYVTSMGEPTTDLCVWALERQGFDVELIYNETSTLGQKLEVIYSRAKDTFLRVDADVIVNSNCTPKLRGLNWWTQYQTFDWYAQKPMYGGVQLIKKEALPILRARVKDFVGGHVIRPETYLFRINEFMYPRRCVSQNTIMGIHGYGIEDLDRVKNTKEERMQSVNYDFELAERLNKL